MTAFEHLRKALDAPNRNGGPPPAELADLLDATVGFVRRFVVMTDAQAAAAALWASMTHVFDAFEQVPYLAVTSAEKRSGKTRLADVLALLVARPWRAVSPSEAVVYRKIEADRPTLLLDEVDAIFGAGPAAAQHEGLRALLNAGNRRGTRVPRCVGASFALVEFNVYCPKALCGLGSLPETVADRAIPIRMRRKAPGELEDRFREREATADAAPLVSQLIAWGSEAVDRLADARPPLPHELNDRAQDAWEPLLAIADLAGGDWHRLARGAAVELAADGEEDLLSLGVRLLADVQAAFQEAGVEQLPTADLLAALAADEEAPWATYRGGGLHARGLASLLRPYGVKPRVIRHGEATPRGYRRADFEDAWSRYLPPYISPGETATSASATDTQRRSQAGMRDVADVELVALAEGDIDPEEDELAWR